MKAYKLLEKPESWIKGDYARTAEGELCSARSPEAVCWCAVGALLHCYGPELAMSPSILADASAYEVVRRRVDVKLGEPVLPKWNDDPARTHADVIALFKELDI